jgi:predicted  nucleic acid-binding Zn-ribbon protein
LDFFTIAFYYLMMTDAPENIVLVYLRRLDEKLDGLVEDLRELKHRMTTVEQQIASLSATEANHYASLASRMDRIERRLDRIERRLELTPAG